MLINILIIAALIFVPYLFLMIIIPCTILYLNGEENFSTEWINFCIRALIISYIVSLCIGKGYFHG